MALAAPGRGERRHGRFRKRLDLPRTVRARRMRSNRLYYRYRRPRPVRTFVLLDVSGSMDAMAGRYLPLLAAAVRQRRVRVFAVSDRLVEVTEALRGKGASALQEASFGRGTRLGQAIEALLAAPDGPSRQDDVLVISDGWEAGDRQRFVEALLALRRRCRRLIWWNPDAASPGFQPTAFSMRLVTRLADVFGSGLEA